MNPDIVAGWLERILEHEGGFSISSLDPGNWTGGVVGQGMLKGTKWGIAANTYPDLDIKNLTKQQAADIYIRDYLAPLKADMLAKSVVFQLLDYGVNSGPARAVKSLQEVVHVTPDGVVGPVTVAAVHACSQTDLVMLLLAQRLDFMTDRKNWETAGKGWARRIAANLRFAAEDT